MTEPKLGRVASSRVHLVRWNIRRDQTAFRDLRAAPIAIAKKPYTLNTRWPPEMLAYIRNAPFHVIKSL
jgi:hypothetical protein